MKSRSQQVVLGFTNLGLWHHLCVKSPKALDAEGTEGEP